MRVGGDRQTLTGKTMTDDRRDRASANHGIMLCPVPRRVKTLPSGGASLASAAEKAWSAIESLFETTDGGKSLMRRQLLVPVAICTLLGGISLCLTRPAAAQSASAAVDQVRTPWGDPGRLGLPHDYAAGEA